MRATLRPGLTHTLTYRVPADRTVPHLLPESGEFRALPGVLATGYLVGIVEWACMRVVAAHLDDHEISLGVHICTSHEAPTLPGMEIRVAATLVRVDGRDLEFTVEARDQAGVVARGSHTRAVVDRARFGARAAARAGRSAECMPDERHTPTADGPPPL